MIGTLLKLVISKDGMYIAIILIMIGSAWYALNDWHYRPIKTLTKKVSSLENELKIIGTAYNTCEANLSKQSVENYQDGLGEGNEDFSFDLDNLSS